jgi:hypothetical protein
LVLLDLGLLFLVVLDLTGGNGGGGGEGGDKYEYEGDAGGMSASI